MLHRFLAAFLLLLAALPLRAAPADDLMRALRVGDMLGIMREEGLAYGEDMAQDMFPGGANDQWSGLVSQIYDVEKMDSLVRRHFNEVFGDTDTDLLLSFFNSAEGRYVVSLEMAARRAMVEDSVEEAARDAYRIAEAEGSELLGQIETFIEANDLIEANVEGALNASFQFYRGLVDGGAFEMSESDILADVWAQEETTRADTSEWLHAFLLMAYGPLDAEAMQDYIDVSESPEGQILNRALFAGFNRMYDEISYALGLAAAQQMKSQDL